MSGGLLGRSAGRPSAGSAHPPCGWTGGGPGSQDHRRLAAGRRGCLATHGPVRCECSGGGRLPPSASACTRLRFVLLANFTNWGMNLPQKFGEVARRLLAGAGQRWPRAAVCTCPVQPAEVQTLTQWFGRAPPCLGRPHCTRGRQFSGRHQTFTHWTRAYDPLLLCHFSGELCEVLGAGCMEWFLKSGLFLCGAAEVLAEAVGVGLGGPSVSAWSSLWPCGAFWCPLCLHTQA